MVEKVKDKPGMKIGTIPVPSLPVGQTQDKGKAGLKIAVQKDNVETNSSLAATTIRIHKRQKETIHKGQGQMIQTIQAIAVAETMEEETTQGVLTQILTLIQGHHSHLESLKIGQSQTIQMSHQL